MQETDTFGETGYLLINNRDPGHRQRRPGPPGPGHGHRQRVDLP